jgi:Cytochrome c, mono- and diheme variants
MASLLLLLLACLPEKTPEDAVSKEQRWAALKTDLQAELGAAYDQPVPGLATADVKNGRNIYQKSCLSCHGANMDGKGGRASTLVPAPSALVGTGADYFSDAAQVHLIRNGVPGTAMAAWGARFGDQQVLDVYAYIELMRKERAAAR